MRTLVLGGGGPVGAAWIAGLCQGFLQRNIDVGMADEILGTSAGAVAGAWLATRTPLDGLIPAMTERATSHSGPSDRALFNRMAGTSGREFPSVVEMRSIAQAAARSMPPVDAAEIAGIWSQWISDVAWPKSLRVTTIDDAGSLRVWDAEDGLSLAEGVAMSTAAPGIAPPVRLRGHIWIDGGVRSTTNADCIRRAPQRVAQEVLVLAPLPGPLLNREIAALHGAHVVLVTPEPGSLADGDLARMLDPAATVAAARAGRRKAATIQLDGWQSEILGGKSPQGAELT